jgi:hypothetical protein
MYILIQNKTKFNLNSNSNKNDFNDKIHIKFQSYKCYKL